MAEKKLVGIDFTNHEIRIAQVSMGRGQPRLERFALGPIPDGVFSGGRLVEPGKLAEAIRDLLRGYRFNAKKAILGISGRYGVTRLVTLPKMTAAQTRDAINLQLNQYVPFPPGDTIYDFKVLREVKEEEQPSQEVLLVATRRTSIQPLMRVMKQAGLSLIGVKITTLASFTLFEDLYTDNEQAVAFVDVRDTVTDISFVAENYFRLSRSVEFGLSNLVERLRQKLGLTHEEAVDHLYRNKVDLMESYRPAAMQTAEEGTVTVAPEEAKDAAALDRQLGLAKSEETIEKQVRDNVLRSMGQFVNELMRSIRYFESQQKRRSRVGRVVIFGYIGGLSGLAEYLAEQTALEVTVVTDVPGVEMGLDDAEQRELKGREAILVVPAGLAAEGVKRRKIEMNLIPRETVYRVKSFNALRYAAALVVILLAVLAVIYINLNKDLAQFKGQEDDLNRKIASIKPYYDKSQQFKGYNATVQGKLGSVLKLAAVQPPWPVVMDELGRVMRDSCFIDEMHFDANGYTFKIHGYVLGTPELEMFLVNLYHSDILKVTKAEDLTNSSKSKSNNTLGSRPSGGGSGGSRYSTPMPGGGEGTIAPVDFGDHSMGSTTPMRPEPMYKLPSNPNEARLIEWYFQGTEFTAPILWEFSIPGTLNTAAMQSGQDLFADLKEILGSAAAGPAKPGGGGPAPSTPAGPAPATPGAPPAGGGDSGGGT